MATKQREISISEFFTKNRHLLGFDNPSKALLTAIKEAVDNSLDACEEAGILPDIVVHVDELSGDRYRVSVEDNGPGIVKAQIPKVFGKLLYGSKFHRLKQSRGQQGIGISAAVMYGQLTTGKPAVVTSRTGKGRAAHHFEIALDTRKNQPDVIKDDELARWPDQFGPVDELGVRLEKEHGTRVEIEMTANYVHGQRQLLRYLEQTALANPHASLRYLRPKAEPIFFPRSAEELPREATEIQPHPHGVELGALIRLLDDTKAGSLKSFLTESFSRVTDKPAQEILAAAQFAPSTRPHSLDRVGAERLHKAMGAAKLMAPPTSCLSPIGDALMRKGLIGFLSVIETEGPEQEELDLAAGVAKPKEQPPKEPSVTPPAAPTGPSPDQPAPQALLDEGEELIKGHRYFVATVTRPPRVYRGNPFQIEVGLAHGGSWPSDRQIELYRFANRVPLLFQRGACAMTEAVVRTDWKNYLLQQSKGALPVGPMALLIHIASVWVPFTSESKEALAHYPEIISEIKLALQECGRKLAAHIRKRHRAQEQIKRRSLFELYIKELSQSLAVLSGQKRENIEKRLLDQSKVHTAAADEEEEGEEETRAAPAAAPPARGEDGEELTDAVLVAEAAKQVADPRGLRAKPGKARKPALARKAPKARKAAKAAKAAKAPKGRAPKAKR
jgi:DNA topoisomerase-6 subunit B